MNLFFNKSRNLTLAETFIVVLSISFFFGCGGTGSVKEKTSSRKFNEQPIPVTKKKVKSDRMAIPFEIAIQAALSGHRDTIQQALKTGTDPNQLDENKRTMLMVAAFNGHADIVEDLLQARTHVNVRDLAGRTALMFASTGKNVQTVELLLKNGAKINLVDNQEQWSALMFAAAEGHRDVVELLLLHKADPALKDLDGSTAASFAKDNGHKELADFLDNLSDWLNAWPGTHP